MPFVLDASVALAWMVDNPVPGLALKARAALFAGERALVPGLWHLEVANALAVAERRGNLSAPDVLRSLTYVAELSSQFIDTESEFVSVRHALNVARTSQLTAYDALYLDMARRNGLPLATLDRELISACSKASVQLFK